MASIKYSAFGGELKGKVGGTIFQGGKSGPIVKNFMHRTFVKVLAIFYGALGTSMTWAGCMATADGASECITYSDGSHDLRGTDVNQRTLLSVVSKSWAQLTVEQRDAWNASAVNFPFRNRFGDLYTASGFQVYMELNLNLKKLNNELLTFPPAPAAPALPNIESSSEFDGEPMTFNFPDGIPAGTKILVYSSPGQSLGRFTSMKNPKLIAVLGDDVDPTVYNLRYMWQVFFGMLNANTKVQFKFVAINNNTGQQGSNMTKAELIDAVASGSKLTKADAGRAFPNTATGETSETTFDIAAFNVGAGVTVELTGADPDQFRVSFGALTDLTDVLTADANTWGNVLPSVLNVAFSPTSIGIKSANVRYLDPNGVTLGVTVLSGTGTA